MKTHRHAARSACPLAGRIKGLRKSSCLRASLLTAAMVAAGPGVAGATTLDCYWVGQTHQTPVINGQGGGATFYTWGDAAGWSMFSTGAGGSCPGGTPQNGTFSYNLVVDNANAPGAMGNLGQRSLLFVVATGQPISPTVSMLTLSHSTLDFDTGTLTTGSLMADSSSVGGGTVVVGGFGGVNTLSNMTFESTALRLSGTGSTTIISGSLALARIKGGSGRSPGSVNWGIAPTLTIGSGSSLIFSNVTLYGQSSTVRSLGTILAASGSKVSFLGNNTVLGSSLQGEFDVLGGSSATFTQAINQGLLASGANANLSFKNGTMSQASGQAAPGFSQTGNGLLGITDLSATAGSFGGLIHLHGDGLGGGAYDNTLSGVNVKVGATLSLESGSTSFNGVNEGTLIASGASLTLSGSVTNDGVLRNQAGATTTVTGALANRIRGSVNNVSTLSIAAGATLNNSGSVNNNSHGVVTNSGSLANFGTLNNNAGAVLINNAGFRNGGSFIDTGIVKGTGTYTQTAGSAQIDGSLAQAAIDIESANFFGKGTVTGPLSNLGGTVQGGSGATPGVLSVKGDFTQGAYGTLQELITGNQPGQASLLAISGSATLDGTLKIVTGTGFSFAAGQVFTIASFDSGGLTGSFARIEDGSFHSAQGNRLAINNNLMLEFSYNPRGIQFQVAAVPEPAESSLMLFGLALTGLWRWRRQLAVRARAC